MGLATIKAQLRVDFLKYQNQKGKNLHDWDNSSDCAIFLSSWSNRDLFEVWPRTHEYQGLELKAVVMNAIPVGL